MSRTPAPLRWTISKASSEFGLDTKTVTKRLQAASVVPGDDGCYSTAQMCEGIFNAKGKANAQERLANALARKAEREEAEAARDLIPVSDVLEVTERFCSAIRQRIIDGDMPEATRAGILREIKALGEADVTEEPEREDE